MFGRRSGALDFVCNCRGPKRCPKMEPKTRTKIGPKSGPKMESGAPNLYGGANKVYMIFIQQSAGRSDSIVQQTNNFNQRRKGNLGGQNCSKSEHEYIHRPNIVKTCFTCKRYTVKSHAWENQQHACYYGGTSMRHRKTACFEALVLELNFAQSCGRFLLLTWGKVLAPQRKQHVWRNLLQVLVRELNHLKQQPKALRQASQLCCFSLQMQFVTIF